MDGWGLDLMPDQPPDQVLREEQRLRPHRVEVLAELVGRPLPRTYQPGLMTVRSHIATCPLGSLRVWVHHDGVQFVLRVVSPARASTRWAFRAFRAIQPVHGVA
jgi:hypothetical protein